MRHAGQEVSFGERCRVDARVRLCERSAALSAKLLRGALGQPGLFRLTIADVLPQDLDARLVSSAVSEVRLAWPGEQRCVKSALGMAW